MAATYCSPAPPTPPRSPGCWAAASAKVAPRWRARSSPRTRRTRAATSCTSNQSGLGLPDESYYREESYAEIRTSYIAHLERLAELVGLPDPARVAETVMELERRSQRSPGTG